MTSESVQPTSGPSRRTVVAVVGAAGLAAALTACGSDDDASGSSTEQGAAAGSALAKTTDIPVGGGKVFSDQKVVVSQPKEGEFKAFSTICTHRQCPMTDLKDDVLSCACHGSQFSVLDGSVKKDPATQALAEKQIKVSGDSITLA